MSSVQGNSSFTGVVNQAASLPTLNVGVLTASSSTSSSVHVPSSPVSGANISSLTAADSGRLLTIPTTTADINIMAPEPADGLVYDFVVAGSLTAGQASIWTNVAGAVGQGSIAAIDSATNSGVSITAGNRIQITTTAAVGDRVKIQSDGTNWYVSGFMAVSGTILLT